MKNFVTISVLVSAMGCSASATIDDTDPNTPPLFPPGYFVGDDASAGGGADPEFARDLSVWAVHDLATAQDLGTETGVDCGAPVVDASTPVDMSTDDECRKHKDFKGRGNHYGWCKGRGKPQDND